MGKLLPPTLWERRRPEPVRRRLTEVEEQRVARDVAAALSMSSHHRPQTDPWEDPDGDYVFWLEEVHGLRRDLVAAERMLAAVTRFRDTYDRDAVDQDRQDARDNSAAHDEAASDQAPRLDQ